MFAAYLAIYLKKFDIAQKYIQIYNHSAQINATISKADNLIILALSKNITKKDLIDYISPIDTNKIIAREIENIYSIIDCGLKLPSCPMCGKCYYSGVCSYTVWKSVQDKINAYGNDHCEKEFADFISRYKK